MRKMRATSAPGATVTGPARVQINMIQAQANMAILGSRWRPGGVFEIGAGQNVTLDASGPFFVDPPSAATGAEPVGWEPEAVETVPEPRPAAAVDEEGRE